MRCPACHRQCDAGDNFCRHCGGELVVEVPVLRQTEPLPVPWDQVRPVVTRGVAAIAAGVVLDLVLRRLGSVVAGTPQALARRPAPEPPARAVYHEITETTLYHRRIRRVE